MRKVSLNHPPNIQQAESWFPNYEKTSPTSTAVHSVNTTMGPDGLTPCLFVLVQCQGYHYLTWKLWHRHKSKDLQPLKPRVKKWKQSQPKDVSLPLLSTELEFSLFQATSWWQSPNLERRNKRIEGPFNCTQLRQQKNRLRPHRQQDRPVLHNCCQTSPPGRIYLRTGPQPDPWRHYLGTWTTSRPIWRHPVNHCEWTL